MKSGTTSPRPLPAFRLDRRVRCTPDMGDLFYPLRPSAEVNEQIKAFCWPGPLRLECLQHGIDHEDWGHFGGLNPVARRRVARMAALHGVPVAELEAVAA